jgi:hypothetical protein
MTPDGIFVWEHRSGKQSRYKKENHARESLLLWCRGRGYAQTSPLGRHARSASPCPSDPVLTVLDSVEPRLRADRMRSCLLK